MAMTIDISVSVDLWSCYLHFKYALCALFTSGTLPLPHLSDVYRVLEGLSALKALAALRVVTQLLRLLSGSILSPD